MDFDITTLKQILRKLQFDESIDHGMAVMAATGVDRFSATYTLPSQTDAGVEYLLHVVRHDQMGQYMLESYDTALYRKLSIPDTPIKGIGIKALHNSLSQIDWTIEPAAWPPEQRESFNDAKRKFIRLSDTAQGRDVAELLIARYCPDLFGLDDLPPRLSYDKERDQYYLTCTSAADDPLILTAPETFSMLVGLMDRTMPHLYQIEISVTDLAIENKTIHLCSAQRFSDIDAAGQLFNKLTPAFFDQEYMQQNNYPWVIKSAVIQDKVDEHWVVSKSADFEKQEGTMNKAAILTFDINDHKVIPIEFLRRANERFPLMPESFGAAIDISELFIPIDLRGQKKANKTPSGKQIRRH